MSGRLDGLDTGLQKLLTGGRTILMNPDPGQIAQALAKVQGRARKNVLTADEAADVYRCVVQGGQTSAHAGLKDCPRGYQFGVTSTVVQVARLHDSLVACSIAREQVLPGQKAVPPISADPFDNPRRWLKEVVSVFWTHLDDRQIAAIQQKAVAAAMELAAKQDHRRSHAHGGERAGIKRKLQLQALFKRSTPIYRSEFAAALGHIVDELRQQGEDKVSWRAFQHRWPSIASRYKRDLVQLFRRGVATHCDLANVPAGPCRYSLSFTTWSGAQTVFAGTQIVFQVCSPLLSIDETTHEHPPLVLRKFLRETAERSPHPVTPETVGWLRVHVDDLHRLVFIDEVQSDVVENLLAIASSGDAEASALAKSLADWHVEGFSTIRHWAGAIGYRVAMHSEQSAMAIPDKTRSARKWATYYAALIKRFKLTKESRDGYPGPIFVDT